MMDRKENAFVLEKLTIGEINLAVLGRAYRAIRVYLERPLGDDDNVDGECGKQSIKETFISWLINDDLYRTERNLALRIVFEEMLAAPEFLKNVDRIFERQVISENGKQ